VTPKFRTHDANVRDSKRTDKELTLARKAVRSNKYEASEAVVRITANA
jgi:hypothetical protein